MHGASFEDVVKLTYYLVDPDDPLVQTYAAIFPRLNRKGKLVTLQDQVHNCVAGAIKGTPPAYDSDKMRLLVVYLTSLSQGKTIDMGGKPH